MLYLLILLQFVYFIPFFLKYLLVLKSWNYVFFLMEWLHLWIVQIFNHEQVIWYWCYLFIAVTVPKVECPKLKVSGSDYQRCNGTYFVTAEKASLSPKMPVYKKQGYDRFIFHYPSSYGWLIGVREYLSPGEKEGNYWFKGKSFSKESLIEFYISHIQYAYVLKIQNLIFKATIRMTQNLGRPETSGMPNFTPIKLVWNV